MNDNDELIKVASRAAQHGAAFIRSQNRPESDEWDLKGSSDFVTAVDRGAEEVIGNALLDGYPDSTILGEELTPDATSTDLLWVVDPLDGTTNYLHDYPAYAVSIAAVISGTLTAAIVLDIPRETEYHATAGGGAWQGDERLNVSEGTDPAQALIGTGWPFKRPALLPEFMRHFAAILAETAGIRRAGSASLDFVDVARGRFDGFWEPYLAPWDVAAGSLIVREAGGLVSGYTGNLEVVRHGDFVAGNPRMHGWLVEMLTREIPAGT